MKKISPLISPYPAFYPRARGFSLVELIVVIVVTGIMAATVGLFIAGPIQAFFDQARRGGLVDAAQLAQLRMGRDLRGALPNSVRVSGSTAIEMLYTLDGDRYRTEPPGLGDDRLDFTGTDTQFNTLAPLARPESNPLSWSRTSGHLAIYPLQATGTGANPYTTTTDRVMTAAATPLAPIQFTSVCVTMGSPPVCAGGTLEFRVQMPSFQFAFDSPTKRVFLVEGPVSYVCGDDPGETDPARLALFRYSGYGVNAIQPVPPDVSLVGTMAVIVKNVTACNFVYAPGTAQRNAVVSLALTLTSQGESILLLRQVQVDNSP